MEKNLLSTGQATATALYAMIFAPIGAGLGPLGDVLVQSSAQGCAQSANDPLSAQFERLLKDAAR